jgi:hypothetical protein
MLGELAKGIVLPVLASWIFFWTTTIDFETAFDSVDSFLNNEVSVPLFVVTLCGLLVFSYIGVTILGLWKSYGSQGQDLLQDSDTQPLELSNDSLLILETLSRLDRSDFQEDEMLVWQKGTISSLRLKNALDELCDKNFLLVSYNYVSGDAFMLTSDARRFMTTSGLI